MFADVSCVPGVWVLFFFFNPCFSGRVFMGEIVRVPPWLQSNGALYSRPRVMMGLIGPCVPGSPFLADGGVFNVTVGCGLAECTRDIKIMRCTVIHCR